jgi:hypothetical protein
MNPLDILRAHRSFNGNREDLAADATVLKEELGLAGEGPSVRIIRHYEQIGCISKTIFAGNLPGPNGEPPARPALMPPEKSPYNVYVYRHLLEVTAIRVLLQDGWQLRRIADQRRGRAAHHCARPVRRPPTTIRPCWRGANAAR